MSVFNLALPIAIGCDHAGPVHKHAIINYLTEKGLSFDNKGTDSTESCDYPDYAHPVAEMVAQGKAAFGILICGSANGVCITANKHKGVRAALCWQKDVAALARQHNDANIICLPARFINVEQAVEFVETFIQTAFEGGRHQLRVEKINA